MGRNKLNILSHGYNSFGELQEIKDENYLVEENAQKIFAFDDKLLAGFAGIVSEGISVLHDIKMLATVAAENELCSSIKKFFDDQQAQETEFIFGIWENQRPNLLYYSEGNLEHLIVPGEFVALGSGADDEEIVDPLFHSLENLSKSQMHFKIALTIGIATMQSCILHSKTFASGVGGFINGAMLTKDGLQWAEDTSCILYPSKERDRFEKFCVNKFNRDGAVAIYSPKKRTSLYTPDRSWAIKSPEQWVQDWSTELGNKHISYEMDFYTFICYDRRIVVVVQKDNPRFESCMKILKAELGGALIFAEPPLEEKMMTYMVDGRTNQEVDGLVRVHFM